MTNCELCGNYVYDEEFECYVCEVDLDEIKIEEKKVINIIKSCKFLGHSIMI